MQFDGNGGGGDRKKPKKLLARFSVKEEELVLVPANAPACLTNEILRRRTMGVKTNRPVDGFPTGTCFAPSRAESFDGKSNSAADDVSGQSFERVFAGGSKEKAEKMLSTTATRRKR